MKLIRSLFWLVFTIGTLLGAMFYIPWFWYLELRGRQRRKEQLAWGFARWWGRAVLWATGSTVKVVGAEKVPEGPVVVMGNHQGYFDIMLVLGYIDKPLAFIAKKELSKLPLVSSWMRYLGCIFLDRKDVRQAVEVFQKAVNQVKSGWSMVIFPEGTRSKSNTLAPFKKGSMKLPLRAGVPIVPVSIDGTYKVFEGNGKRIGPAQITLVVAEPIMPEQISQMDTGDISQLVRERIEQGLKTDC